MIHSIKLALSVVGGCLLSASALAKEPASVLDLVPDELVTAAGEKVVTADALKGKVIGLYFSASW